MRFVFRYEGEGLRILPEIPDLRLCHIEGRNGIGKSLSVRLLLLACGHQPYSSTPLAWASLKEQLTSCTIVCEASDQPAIEFVLTPTSWPQAADDLHDDDLGSVRIGGSAATFADARERIDVLRIAGDETLSDTLAASLTERASSLEQATAPIEDVADRWEIRLSSFVGLTGGLAPDELVVAAESANQAMAASGAALAGLQALRSRIADLNSLAALEERIQHVHDELPRLETQLASAKRELLVAENDLEHRESEMRALLEERSDSKSLRAEVQRLNTLLKRRQTNLGKAEVELSHRLSLVGLDEVPSDAERGRLATEASGALADAVKRRTDLDTIGPAVEVVEDLGDILEGARDGGLGSTVVARMPEPLQASVLLAGVGLRRRELAEQPRPGELEAVVAEIQMLERRVAVLEELPSVAGQFDRARARVDETSRELAVALGRTGPAAEGALQALQASVGRARETRSDLQLHVRQLENRVDELQRTSPEVLGEQADELARDLGVPRGGVQEVLALAQEESSLRDAEHAELDQQASAEVGTIDLLLRRLANVEPQLSTPEFGWLAEPWAAAQAASIDAPSVPPEIADILSQADLELAARIAILRQACETLADDTVLVRDALLTTQVRVEHLASDVRERAAGKDVDDREEPDQIPDLSRRVRSFCEEWLAQSIATEAVRGELFDGADSVAIDLRTLTVQWYDGGGAKRKRPLEAFSSGEQAFSYVLAKLSSLRRRSATAHVVLVLDEFGAFVARDRLAQLWGAVRQRALGVVADQVIVVLPLSHDYLAEQEPEPGDTGAQAARIRQVKARDYFAEPVPERS